MHRFSRYLYIHEQICIRIEKFLRIRIATVLKTLPLDLLDCTESASIKQCVRCAQYTVHSKRQGRANMLYDRMVR